MRRRAEQRGRGRRRRRDQRDGDDPRRSSRKRSHDHRRRCDDEREHERNLDGHGPNLATPPFMKNALVLAVLVLAACGNSKPADQPPGQSTPGSPGSAWSTQGGPASPGSPAMGTVQTTDAGAPTH